MTAAVLFDFYGTLARATAWGVTHDDVLARHGYEPGVALRGWLSDDGLFDGQEHHEHSRSRDHYRAWELERLRALARRAGVGPDDLDALVADLDAAGKEFTLTPFDEAAAVLRALRDREVVVAVCSNWDWDLDRALTATGLADLVDHQVTSARAGVRKPHPHIYEHTLARCRVAPDRRAVRRRLVDLRRGGATQRGYPRGPRVARRGRPPAAPRRRAPGAPICSSSPTCSDGSRRRRGDQACHRPLRWPYRSVVVGWMMTLAHLEGVGMFPLAPPASHCGGRREGGGESRITGTAARSGDAPPSAGPRPSAFLS